MTGKQLDPEEVERIMDAFAPLAEQLAAFIAAVTPVMRRLAELAASPQGQAFIAAAEAMRDDPDQECHCLCIKNHPGTHQRCLWYVPASEIVTREFGLTDVPMCRPCADSTPAPPPAGDR